MKEKIEKTQELENASAINRNEDDKLFDVRVNRFLIRNMVSIIGVFGWLLFGLSIVFFFQTRSEHRIGENERQNIREQVAEINQKVEDKVGQTSDILVFLSVLENKESERLKIEENRGLQEQAEITREILKSLEQIKRRNLENGDQKK